MKKLIVCILILAVAGLSVFFYLSRMKIMDTSSNGHVTFLSAVTGYSEAPDSDNTDSDCLVLTHSADSYSVAVAENCLGITDMMGTGSAKVIDVSQAEPEFDGYKRILMTFTDFGYIKDNLADLMEWVDNGGSLLVCGTPYYNDPLMAVKTMLGITELEGYSETESTGVIVRDSGFLVGVRAGEVFEGEPYGVLHHSSLRLRVSNACTTLLSLTGEYENPLAWKRDYGAGRVVVYNALNLSAKASRGVLCALITQLNEVTVYPVMNTATFFLDDFPSPIPTNVGRAVQELYRSSNEDFFYSVWWKDMQNLSEKYGVKYTGAMTETFDAEAEKKIPFSPEIGNPQVTKIARQLNHYGHELAVQGMNHIPLSLHPLTDIGGNVVYRQWQSMSNMRESVKELYRFYKETVPSTGCYVYIPPSFYLTEEGKEAMHAEIPEIKVISGAYLGEAAPDLCVQEFEEDADGLLMFPQITRGHNLTSEQRWLMAGAMTHMGVISHSMRPYDVLSETDENNGWNGYRDGFEDILRMIEADYPFLRYTIASEAARAMQVYLRAGINVRTDGSVLTVTRPKGSEEGYFYLKTEKAIASSNNCKVTPVSQGYSLITAEADTFTIEFGEPTE